MTPDLNLPRLNLAEVKDDQLVRAVQQAETGGWPMGQLEAEVQRRGLDLSSPCPFCGSRACFGNECLDDA